jgi:hypothetical protein
MTGLRNRVSMLAYFPRGVCYWCRRSEALKQGSFAKKSGAAIVEFAIVAPVFFLLVLGMIEFGRMVMVQQVLTNASREGARVAVLDGTSPQEVFSRVQALLEPAGIWGAEILLDPNPPSLAGPGEPVTVTVRVPFRQVSWLPAPFFLRNITLRATTVMQRETT